MHLLKMFNEDSLTGKENANIVHQGILHQL